MLHDVLVLLNRPVDLFPEATGKVFADDALIGSVGYICAASDRSVEERAILFELINSVRFVMGSIKCHSVNAQRSVIAALHLLIVLLSEVLNRGFAMVRVQSDKGLKSILRTLQDLFKLLLESRIDLSKGLVLHLIPEGFSVFFAVLFGLLIKLGLVGLEFLLNHWLTSLLDLQMLTLLSHELLASFNLGPVVHCRSRHFEEELWDLTGESG